LGLVRGSSIGDPGFLIPDATGTLPVSNAAGTVTAEELHMAILVTQAMRFSKVMTTKDWLANL